MKKFMTRIERAEAATEVSTQQYAIRIRRMSKVKFDNSNKRIAKKVNDFATRTALASQIVIDASSRINFNCTDAELKQQIWAIQQNSRKALVRLGARIPNITGIMGMYRFTLENLSVQRMREVNKEIHNEI